VPAGVAVGEQLGARAGQIADGLDRDGLLAWPIVVAIHGADVPVLFAPALDRRPSAGLSSHRGSGYNYRMLFRSLFSLSVLLASPALACKR